MLAREKLEWIVEWILSKALRTVLIHIHTLSPKGELDTNALESKELNLLNSTLIFQNCKNNDVDLQVLDFLPLWGCMNMN